MGTRVTSIYHNLIFGKNCTGFFWVCEDQGIKELGIELKKIEMLDAWREKIPSADNIKMLCTKLWSRIYVKNRQEHFSNVIFVTKITSNRKKTWAKKIKTILVQNIWGEMVGWVLK